MLTGKRQKAGNFISQTKVNTFENMKQTVKIVLFKFLSQSYRLIDSYIYSAEFKYFLLMHNHITNSFQPTAKLLINMQTYFVFFYSIMYFLLVKVQAELHEPSSSPSQKLNIDSDTIILDTHIIYPKKISIGETKVVLSMGGSISLFSFLYYYCLVRKNKEEHNEDELTSTDEMSSSHSYTLGIASPHGSNSSWIDKGIVSSKDSPDLDESVYKSRESLLGSFPIALESKFKSPTEVGRSKRSKRSVTFSGVDTGWANFDEEVGCDSDLFSIEEGDFENDCAVEI
jgi:hypothetical protein